MWVIVKGCHLRIRESHHQIARKPRFSLELLRKYGFTDAYVPKLINRWPNVLLSCPKKTLLPKLEFFCSIGVPPSILARRISSYPVILQRSLENYLIPSYNFLKTLVKSDRKVLGVFKRAPRAFAREWQREISSNITILREAGNPKSSIVLLMAHQPSFLVMSPEKLASRIDRAAEMGFERSKVVFIHAIQVFAGMSESTRKHKMETYRRCGWSESDISLALSKHPNLSEKKIMDNMNFLVNDLGLQPDAIGRLPILLNLNLDRRMKLRYLVARILKEKGLLTKRIVVLTLLRMPEKKFLESYIVNYQKDFPLLLDIYQGKMNVSKMGFGQEIIFK